MVIWKIEGDAIGGNDASAAYFPTKAAAEMEMKEYNDWCKNSRDSEFRASGPFKIVIRNREELARELNAAMGHGGN